MIHIISWTGLVPFKKSLNVEKWSVDGFVEGRHVKTELELKLFHEVSMHHHLAVGGGDGQDAISFMCIRGGGET